MQTLLHALNLSPVLVDVGASYGPPGIWRSIASRATYVGFDPDSREMIRSGDESYHRSFIVNEAVTSEPGAGEVRFFLTRAPYCSSTLEPDLASLANYHYHDLFTPERETTVRAATLDAVLARLGLERIDWLKCDSQGTDLRIFRSLGERVRRNVLALDIEPGLINAYRGEDLFVDAHKHLVANGFWLSRLDVRGAMRIRESTLRAVAPEESDHVLFGEQALRASPGWCEARYLRTLESLAESGATNERYALLCVFALVDDQPGYALDVALEYERRFGADAASARLRAASSTWLSRARRRAALARAWRRFRRIIRPREAADG